MKADGLTLLDDTLISKGETENVGVAFPENPKEGMVWELINAEGISLGSYVYGLGKWMAKANPNLTYSDVSFSTEGVIPSDETITRYAVSKPCYLHKNFEFSVAVLLLAGNSNSTLTVELSRNGVETKLAEIHFAMGEKFGDIRSAIAEDKMLATGDILIFKSKTMDADASDICVTLSTYLA